MYMYVCVSVCTYVCVRMHVCLRTSVNVVYVCMFVIMSSPNTTAVLGTKIPNPPPDKAQSGIALHSQVLQAHTIVLNKTNSYNVPTGHEQRFP